MSTAKQRQILGHLRRLINLNDETYYDMLSQYNVNSSKDLSSSQIYELIKKLRNDAQQMGVFKPKPSFVKYKYNNLSGRDKKMASPKQLRKIEAMWNDKTRAKTQESKEKALKSYIKRITKKEDMRFLTAVDVRKIITALENTNK